MDELKGICREEIALEGLDGITLGSLWFRLQDCTPPFLLPIDDYSKPFIWELVTTLEDVNFYELPTARPPITVADDAKEFSELLGTYVWFDQVDVEPLELVTDEENGIRGCSTTYYTRRNITSEVRPETGQILTLAEVESRFGDKFVIVASQETRFSVLMGPTGDPKLEMKLNAYCTLEYIGKSRSNGRLQTELASAFKIEPKNAHYIRKVFTSSGIVTKQPLSYFIKSTSVMKWGVILLLSRFHNKLFSSYQYLMEQISNFLETQPERETTLSSVREHLLNVMEEKCLNQRKIKKFYELLQNTGLTKFYMRPHTEVYGQFAEDTHKVGSERQVRVVKLLKTYHEYTQELEENEQVEPELCITQSQMIAEQPWPMQVYRLMRTGVSKVEICNSLQLSLLEVRRFIKKLMKDNQIETYFHSEGKHKYRRFVAVSLQEPNLSQSEKAARQEIKELKLEVEHQSRIAKTSDVPETEVVSITPEKKPQLNLARPSYDQTRMSIKENRRRKIILKELERSKVVSGSHCLRKLIMKQEKKEGHSEVCAAKTMVRLIRVLKKDGLVNVIHTVVPTSEENTPKKLMLITLPDLSEKDELVRTLIKATQFKATNQKTQFELHSTIYRAQQKKKQAKQLKKLLRKVGRDHSDDEEDAIKKGNAPVPTTIPKVKARPYLDMRRGPPSSSDQQSQGYMRKMARARIMYTYIWYLVYGHPQRSESNMLNVDDLSLRKSRSRRTQPSPAKYGQDFIASANLSQTVVPNTDVADPSEMKNEIGELMDMVSASSDQCSEPSTSAAALTEDAQENEDFTKDLKVYCEEMSWKRFLPPMPRYSKCADGWFYVTDVIMIMPLSIFCSLIMLSVKIRNLQEYLNDPLKKHIPLMFLPETVQQQLCYHRKYIRSFHMGLQRLCQMGLLTFGPSQDFFDKDQVFCFLHKKGSIVDTTSCKKHYNKINPDNYATKHYTLDSEFCVAQFFRDLQVICLNTPLGLSRRNQNAELPKTLEEEKMMIKELQVTVEDISIVPEDTGNIPGNSRGAAGLDSRMFAHLRKNWNLPAPALQSSTKKYKPRPKTRMEMLKARKNRQKALGKKSGLKAVNVVSETQKGRQEKVKGGRGLKRPKPLSEVLKKKKPVKRVRNNSENLSVSVGPRTKMILKRHRFEWSEDEDNMLLMFQIATLLFAKRRDGFFVPWCHRRDILQKYFPTATDKTTNGVMRRSQLLLKSQAFRMVLATNLGQLQNDEVITEALKKDIELTNEVCQREYTNLVELTIQRLRLDPTNIGKLPLTLTEFHEVYETFKTPEMLQLLPRYKIPEQVKWKTTDLEEIKKLVVRQAVMASFFMIDRPVLFNPSQAFYVFNQFKEDFLLQVVGALKEAYLTTRNRFRRRIRRVLPCTAMSLQVSGTCRRTFNSTISSQVIKEAYEYMQALDEEQYGSNAPFNVPIATTRGQVACFVSMICCNLVEYGIHVPDQVILLDSSFINKATLERTAKLMGNVGGSSDESDGNDDDEVDPQQAQNGEQKTTSKRRTDVEHDTQKSTYPMYKRMTRIQKISDAFEEKEIDQRTAAREQEPDTVNKERSQVVAKFVNTEHSYTQMMPTIAEKSAPSETAVPMMALKNSATPAEKDSRKMKQQDTKLCSTRTDWFLLQGLGGDEGMSDEGCGMLDAIMLKPCRIEMKICKPLQENMHRFNGNTPLSSDDLHQIFDSADEMNLYFLRKDFISFSCQRDEDIKTEWTCLEQFQSTKFIPIPVMKKASMDNIICTLSNEESTLFHLISDKHQLGLTASEIMTSDCQLDVHVLIGNLHKLMKKNLIFRVGLDVHRYVAVHYCDIWSISSAQYAPTYYADSPTPKVKPKLTEKTDDSEEVIEEEIVSIETEEIYEGAVCTVENIQNDDVVDVIPDTSTNIPDEYQKENSKQTKIVVADSDCKLPIPVSSNNSPPHLNSNSDLQTQNQPFNGNHPRTSGPNLENAKDGSENPHPTVAIDGDTDVNKSPGSNSQQHESFNDSIQEQAPMSSTRKTRKRRADFETMISADMILTKETEKIQFIPRQWYNLGGEVDMDELVRLFQKLGLIVISKPGIPEKNIIKQLHLVLSPVECKEILQMLEQAGCITKHLIPKLPSSHPFVDASDSNETEYYYKPTPDCLLRLAAYERYKTMNEVPVENQDESQSIIE